MKLTTTPIEGVVVLQADCASDERGYFVRLHSAPEFEAHSLPPVFEQTGISHNLRKGTLRGLHFQTPPCAEAKLVRCIAGAVFDVVVDVRAGSATFGRSFSLVLEAANPGISLYLPAGMAHGFQTLADASSILYQISGTYSRQHEAGIRWDDPELAIDWPLLPSLMSQRDRDLPLVKNYRPS
ncbi:MAG: dTDP-4-dehydrorhamnose 3,5-epimerase [Betaproteobacteria bacterium]|nr:dTDP-4-dehydrorhamnose 3,5-epimerase [Betaproteobacteria bacterium]